MTKFYSVTLEENCSTYYFKEHESACAFLLESFFDDYEVENEEDVIAINIEVADTDEIADYGYIAECWFED